MENNITLRIIEDDERIREMLRAVFIATPGMHVESVHGSVEDALALTDSDGVDVVLMDINLPGVDGIEGVRTLSGRWNSTQFLMYTVNDTDDKVFEALKAGANGYLLKNSTPDDVVSAVREVLAGGSPMSMSVARRVVRHFRPATGPAKDVIDAALTEREFRVLELLAQGLLYKEIAAHMGISEGSVKQHIHRIYGKMHVQNRTEAVNRYFGR
ncbi:MAG TPA: response regulator transcription factor [Flavobacteriales bacterium]|nr:response regulator transcription factor [Flavobacteriales bacterium]HNU57386.1 response regulator transcription factor [Flavobacteriales bacterium]